MKFIFKLGLLFCLIQTHAQVGINTTAPNAQLEIKASNTATPSNKDGIIIPRVDAFPAANPTVSQQGMMLYLTTASGANAPGFYYWDNTTANWVGIISTANGDKDWYKAGTTTTPSNTDSMYHMGNVGIGTNNPTLPLQFASALGDKVALWGSGTNHYGFGVQSTLMQIHADYNISDIAFGYGSSAAFTENVRFKGNGFVGIGNTNPTVPLQFGWSTGDKISFFGNAAAHHGIGVQDYLLQIHGGLVSDDIAFGYGNSASMTEVMRIKGNGNVGIGTSTPGFPLSFGPNLGDKIALYGASGSTFGFGVQNSLFQIHASNNTDDIAFGYGSSSSFTERMRIKGSGNVGIGVTAPLSKLHVKANNSGMMPNASAVATIESNEGAYFNLLSGGESGILFGANSVATNGGIIYNPSTVQNGFLFRTNGNVNKMVLTGEGFLGVGGTYVPQVQLHLTEFNLGEKIALWGTAASNYGFGVQNKLLQIHSDISDSDIAFGYGPSASFTERMRIKGTGEVGIGTTTPTAELEVNGFTKMGTTAPAVKMIKLTGTTSASQGSQATINHGLTSSKILAVNILVEYSTGNSVPPSYTASGGYEYDYYVTASQIIVWNKTANSSSILSKPIRILVTYEE